MSNANTVTLMILDTIIYSDGFKYDEKSIFENVRKLFIGDSDESHFLYLINEDYTHLITTENQSKVIELGFINTEVFHQIEEIRKSGGSVDVSKLLDAIADMQKNINQLTDENKTMKNEIDVLNKKYNGLAEFGEF